MEPASPAPAHRMAAVRNPVIPRLAALMASRPGCLSLAQGMVGWEPPPEVARTVRRALQEGGASGASLHRYGSVAGDPELLEAVRRELVHHRGLDLGESELLVTAGSNMAFAALAQVICDPGDEVILPVPWYFNHLMAIQLAGGVPVPVAAGLIPDPERLAAAITPRTRALVTISPGNPSGVVIPPDVLTRINRLCSRHGLFHISDEAYAAFVHGAVPHRSPGAAPGSGGHTVSLFSLSKAYGMAGWRVGYAAVPRRLLGELAKVQDTVQICPPRVSQLAAQAALAAGPAWCRPRVAGLAPSRRLVLAAVERAGAEGSGWRLLAEPDGAFYALLATPSPLAEGVVVERLVRDHGVAVLPGGEFGLEAGEGQVVLRLSYGMLPPEQLTVALVRLRAGLESLAERGQRGPGPAGAYSQP